MVINPLGLDLHDGTGYAPRHEVRNTLHMETIAADMTRDGWTGAPIVGRVDWAQAITGSHRIPAAALAGVDVPVVDIFDLADATGIDLDDLIATYGGLEEALPAFCAEVPADIAEAYGLDID
ncbi:hypothetical protein [Streptosporangium sp. NPDC004631]